MADAILVVPPAIIDVSEDVEPYITVEGGKSHIGHVKPKNFRAGDTVRTTFINISPAAANLKKDGVVQTATATGDNYIEFTATADLGGSMDEVTFIAVQQNWEPDPSYEEIRFILEPATNTIVGSTHFHANAIDYPDKRIATGDAAGFNATPADLQFDWTTILGSNIEMIPRAGGTVNLTSGDEFVMASDVDSINSPSSFRIDFTPSTTVMCIETWGVFLGLTDGQGQVMGAGTAVGLNWRLETDYATDDHFVMKMRDATDTLVTKNFTTIPTDTAGAYKHMFLAFDLDNNVIHLGYDGDIETMAWTEGSDFDTTHESDGRIYLGGWEDTNYWPAFRTQQWRACTVLPYDMSESTYTAPTDSFVVQPTWLAREEIAVSNAACGYCGTLNAMLIGQRWGGSETSQTFENDGSTWTETNDCNADTRRPAATGTQGAAVMTGGSKLGTSTDRTEEYNGSTWTTVTAMPADKYDHGMTGTQTAALVAMGPTANKVSYTYDGSSYTTEASVTGNAVGRGLFGSSDTSAATFHAPDSGSPSNSTVTWDGTSWTSAMLQNTTKYWPGACGSATNGLRVGNGTGSFSAAEECDGVAFIDVQCPSGHSSYFNPSVAGDGSNALMIGGGSAVEANTLWACYEYYSHYQRMRHS